MKTFVLILAGSLLLGAAVASAEVDIRKEEIHFKKGTSAATLEGKIKGYQTVDYQLRARQGQSITVDFKPSNLSAYFNVLPPGSETALFIGSTSGNHYAGELPADGLYTIRVYLMRSAARRNETATYTLDVGVKGGEKPAASGTAPFDGTLALQGISFHVTTDRDDSGTTLRIAPAALEIDNSPIVRPIDGTVTGAEVADLNVDGSPEYKLVPGEASWILTVDKVVEY
jgi:hypothetical protein